MFDAFISDDSDETKKTPVKRQRSEDESGNNADNESDTRYTVKRPRPEEETGNEADNDDFSEPIGKRPKRKKLETLSSRKKKLFRKVCSGLDPNFKSEMSRKNPVYIEELSHEIDDYVDTLVRTNYTQNIDLMEFDIGEIGRDIVCTPLMKQQCGHESDMIGDKGCVRLPGYYEQEGPKQFIPQLYHILQDYGFFLNYLKFPMMDTKLSLLEVSVRWSLKLGRILGGFNSKRQEYAFITKMLLRLRRVQFMRAFDVKCCLDTISNKNHEPFDDVLQGVYDALLDERAELVQNNPHMSF